MQINVQIEGIDKLTRKLSNIAPDIDMQIKAALDSSGRQIASDAKRSIQQGAKTGRLYKRRTVTHRASAPGQAPASDTGRLASSITSSLMDGNKLQIRASTKYARWLELGTRFIKPRPYMRPAYEKNKSFLIKRISYGIKKALEKLTR